MPTIIEINCNDQVLVAAKMPVLASGGVDENKIIFKFSSEWLEFDKKVIFYNTPDEIYTVNIDENGEAYIPSMVTAKPGKIYISVYGENDGSIRTTDTIEYVIRQGAITDGTDPLEKYKEQWEEETKGELATALERSAEASELDPIPPYDIMTMGELIVEVGNNLILTEEKQKTINDYNLILNVIEIMPILPMLLQNSNGITEPYSLPYLYTRSFNNISSSLVLSAYVESCGFDLTSCRNNALFYGGVSIFRLASRLKELKLTHCETQTVFTSMFSGRTQLAKVELYDFNKNHDVTNVYRLFYNCSQLENINFVNGKCTEEIDWTGLVDNDSFYQCVSLSEIRFKKFTIQNNISFSYSSTLSPDSILSIINGLDELQVGKTVSFNARIRSLMQASLQCNVSEDEEGNTIFVMAEAGQGEMTFAEAITVMKGWNLS